MPFVHINPPTSGTDTCNRVAISESENPTVFFDAKGLSFRRRRGEQTYDLVCKPKGGMWNDFFTRLTKEQVREFAMALYNSTKE